jgi:hypothetical protein
MHVPCGALLMRDRNEIEGRVVRGRIRVCQSVVFREDGQVSLCGGPWS